MIIDYEKYEQLTAKILEEFDKTFPIPIYPVLVHPKDLEALKRLLGKEEYE